MNPKLNSEIIAKLFEGKLQDMAKHPEKVTEEDKSKLESIYHLLCKTLGISESAKWCINWKAEKFADEAAYKANKPFETRVATQNIVVDVGATEMLKLICGISGATPYNATNAKIGIGNDRTPENASQTALIATSPNVFYKGMESGYPKVEGRTMLFKSAFSTNEANFEWNEFAIVNGTGVGGVIMNRKVESLGTKVTGIWSLQITISLTSNS